MISKGRITMAIHEIVGKLPSAASFEKAEQSLKQLQEGPHEYRLLSKNDIDETVKVFTYTFCHDEPMTHYLGITEEEFEPFARQVIEKAAMDQLSVVALKEGKIIGCAIVEDVTDPLNIIIDIDPKFRFIFALLEHLTSDFFNEKIFSSGHVAHLFVTAVAKACQGKGIAKELNAEVMRIAKQKKFSFMYSEFTHYYNEQAVLSQLKQNKLKLSSCKYKDFIYATKHPFDQLEGYASAYIWALHDKVNLTYQTMDQESKYALI